MRDEIKRKPCPHCFACNSEGLFIHLAQKDRLFGADGSWDLKQCSNRDCGLVWLDPMPLREDIGKAYAHYYTHLPGSEVGKGTPLKEFYQLLKRGYLGGKYNYQKDQLPWLARSAANLLYLFPAHRGFADESVRFLSALPRGRLLDVGCGAGEWLASMRELGWDVEGVDFDAGAVRIARQKGIKVACGSVEDQNFSGESFDAITLNHVIEHVSDPLCTLIECARLLKPTGKLVVLTPNVSSLGHRLFKHNWRGLEPPRHLHLMSPNAMCELLAKAGFVNTCVATRNSEYILRQSWMLWAGKSSNNSPMPPCLFDWCATKVMALLEGTLLTMNPLIGECIVTISGRR